jgi:hypothetical protein
MRHPVWPRSDFLKAAGLTVSALDIGDGPADAAPSQLATGLTNPCAGRNLSWSRTIPIALHEVVAIDL